MTYNKNNSKLPVKHVTSVGAVILNPKNQVLIMFQKQNKYWELPKGKVEPGEEKVEMVTLRREIKEETGLDDLDIVKGFRDNFRYQFKLHGSFIKKNNIYYIAKVTNSKVKLSEEHTDYKWLSFAEANKIFKHKNQKILLNKVKNFLDKENE